MKAANHYEFLQISPNAEADTIHRVYRFLAIRYHPDNAATGDADRFYQLTQAYAVLSNPARRAEYDAACASGGVAPDPISSSVDFMDDLEGEVNRRLAVLALLYLRRRTAPDHPEVSLFEVETRMGFPRDYLEFTIWYLQKKEYITRADNAAFTLTVEGVDFVETQRSSVPVLQKLLASQTGGISPEDGTVVIAEGEAGLVNTGPAAAHSAPPDSTTPDSVPPVERRTGRDRRKRPR